MTRSLPTRLGPSGEVEDEGRVFLPLPWHWVGDGADGPVGPELPPTAPALLHSLLTLLYTTISPAWVGCAGKGPAGFGLGDEDFFQLLSYGVGSALAIARW